MKKHKILELLKRTDKWYLGGGNRLLWAPEFPLFLDYPGFWDNAMYYNFPFQPLFTWTILSDSGEEIKLKFIRRIWTPAEIVQEYKCSINNINMRVYERKSLLPVDAATSSISI